MPSPAEVVAQTYVAAWQEPDAAARGLLLDGCLRGRWPDRVAGAVIRGRAALAAAIDDFFADPRGLSADS